MIEEASRILDVEVSTLQEFDVIDSFNNDNQLVGVLCCQSDHRYGAMVVFAVNGTNLSEPQVIYCTPKLRYPFERNSTKEESRKYRWPKFLQVKIYEKVDGTNVCQYRYYDATGASFVSYKTRLTPVLKASKFGNFLSMWREMLSDREANGIYDDDDVVDLSVSYELYGYRNHILIRYDEPLVVRELFSVNQSNATVNLPADRAGLVAEATSAQDLTEIYERMRDEAQAKNEKVNAGSDDEFIEGIEGYVFYVLTVDGNWEMFKMKPEMVEAAHWSTGGIPMSIIMPTIWNSLESNETPTVSYTEELLLEEFSREQVAKSSTRIEKGVEDVLEQIVFRAAVQSCYEDFGLDWKADGRGGVMRRMSTAFHKQKMRQVYTALVRLGYAPQR